MTRRSATLGTFLALSLVGAIACDKKKDGEGAVAEAAAPVVVADAAPEAEAPAVAASAVPLTPPPVVAKPAAPKPKADPDICRQARAARQRSSPAFENLAAQCKAAGGIL